MPRICSDCEYGVPVSAPQCPHCGRPGFYPDVDAAAEEQETAAVEARYCAALQSLSDRGVVEIGRDLERALEGSQAVIFRPAGHVQWLATSDHHAYATYYKLTESGAQFATGDHWDLARGIAAVLLHLGQRKEISHAALSLKDGNCLRNYGDWALVLRTSMIAHRSYILEANSAVLAVQRIRETTGNLSAILRGYRATWHNRVKLVMAKLARTLCVETTPGDFGSLLLSQGDTSENDRFVEVNVCGPLTIRAVETVRFHPPEADEDPVATSIILNLRNKIQLLNFHTEIEVKVVK